MKAISKEEWITRFHKCHGDKYDYSESIIQNQKSIIKIFCKKHKVYFNQMVISHANGNIACRECQKEKKSQKKYTTETFISSLPESLKKYNYSYEKTIYTGIYNIITVNCPIHGDFKIKATKHLLGHKCKQCELEEKSKKFRSNTEKFVEKCKKQFKDVDYDYSVTKYGKNAKDEIEIKCPNCGIIKTTPLKFLYSKVGCYTCNGRKYIGEEKIKDVLKKEKIEYKYQFVFPDLKDKKNLSYDFFLKEKNLLIEYNGKQHYDKKSFGKTYKEFLLQKHHDWLKRNYAKKNGITLLVIPYWDFDNITKILKEKINDNK